MVVALHRWLGRLILSLSLLSAGPATAEQLDALIWGAEPTAEAARARVPEATQKLQGAGLVFPEGFPLAIRSDEVSGLKPGFEIIILGYCSSERTPLILHAAKGLNPGTYVRKVKVSPAGPACPTLTVKPPVESINAQLAYEVMTGKLESVQKLLSQGPDQRGKDVALVVAAGTCNPELVKLLLGVGARPNADVRGASRIVRSTALTAAVSGQCSNDAAILPTAQILLEAGADPNLAEETGASPVELAAGSSVEATKLLLSRGADPTKSKRSPLTQALLNHHSELLPLFLSRGVSLELPGTCEAAQCTALVAATLVEDAASVRLLRAKGASLDGRSSTGFGALDAVLLYDFPGPAGAALVAALLEHPSTALHRAALAGDVAAMKPLLSRETVNVRQGGWTPLMLAALAGKTEAVKALLAAGADPNLLLGSPSDPQGGRSTLMLGVMSGSVDVVDQLLRAKADPAVPGSVCCGLDRWILDSYSQRPHAVTSWPSLRTLAPAFRNGREGSELSRLHMGLRKMESWLREGASVDDSPYLVSMTPLHLAALLGHARMIPRLIAAGIPVDARDETFRFTPLMLAAEQGNLDAVEALLQAGAAPDAPDGDGFILLTRAVARGAPKPVIEALLKKGGTPILHVPMLLTAAATGAPVEVVKLLLARGAGKDGTGKDAAQDLCGRGTGDPRDRQVYNLLEKAGYASWPYDDCVHSGEGD